MKRNILIVLSVVVLLIVGSAVVLAGDIFTDDQQDWYDTRADQVESLVDEGIITQEQADKYLEQLEQCILDGTCNGYGSGCNDGEECGFGIDRDGGCLGIKKGYGNGFCRQNSDDGTTNFSGNGCSSVSLGRGCGR